MRNLDQDLIDACVIGDVSKVKDSLEKGANPDCQNSSNFTPLQIVAAHINNKNYLDIMLLLLQHPATTKVNPFNPQTQISPLIYALNALKQQKEAKEIIVQIVSLLIIKGIDVNVRDIHLINNKTHAEDERDTNAAVENETVVMTEDRNGFRMSYVQGKTALMLAVEAGDLDCVLLLLNVPQLDVYAIYWQKEKRAWVTAKCLTNDRVIKRELILAEQSYKIDHQVLSDCNRLHYFASKRSLSEELLQKASSGDPRSVEELLLKGAEVNFITGNGTSALCIAAGNGHLSVMSLLLYYGAKIDSKSVLNTLFISTLLPVLNESALIAAIQHKQPAAVAYLLDLGVSPFSSDDMGCAPFFAASYSSLEILKLILSYIPDVQPLLPKLLYAAIPWLFENEDSAKIRLEKVDYLLSLSPTKVPFSILVGSRCDTQWHCIKWKYLSPILHHPQVHLDMNPTQLRNFLFQVLNSDEHNNGVGHLLDWGADPYSIDNGSRSVFKYAAYYGAFGAIYELLSHPRLFSVGGSENFSLIHFTINHNRLDLLFLVLKRGVNVNTIYEGETPLTLAINLNRWDAARRLLKVSDIDVSIKNSTNQSAGMLINDMRQHPAHQTIETQSALSEIGTIIDEKAVDSKKALLGRSSFFGGIKAVLTWDVEISAFVP